MVTAEEIEHALEGIHYPASKDDILRYAEQNDAPADVLGKLDKMDSEWYASIHEVWDQFGMKSEVSWE